MLLYICLATAATAVAQDSRIAYVDMKKILDNAPQVLAGRSRLDDEFRFRNEQVQQDEVRLEALRQQLTASTNPLLPGTTQDPNQRRRVEQEIRLLERSIERRKDELRQELQLRRNEEISRVEAEINQAIASIARERGYDLIVASPVVYASDRIDITDEILLYLQQEHAADQAEQQPPASESQP